MTPIRWYVAELSHRARAPLLAWDHHHFPLRADAAVLISYLAAADGGLRVYAVVHPAAVRHPRVPAGVAVQLGSLDWRRCGAPDPVVSLPTPGTR